MGMLKSLSRVFVEDNDGTKAPPTIAAPDEEALKRLLAQSDQDMVALSGGPVGAPRGTMGVGAVVPTPEVDESSTFEEIYLKSQVPTSAYPAEKLLKFLENIKNLDAPTRQSTVAAMADSDDDWDLADPVNDATLKVKALTGAKAAIHQGLQVAEGESARQTAENAAYIEKAEALIREQIAELEAQLAAETSEVNAKKEAILASLHTKQNKCQAEQAKLDAEISRLQELPNTFGSAVTNI